MILIGSFTYCHYKKQDSLYSTSLQQLVSFDNLSTFHKAFVTKLNSIDIPKTVQEALGDGNWRKKNARGDECFEIK